MPVVIVHTIYKGKGILVFNLGFLSRVWLAVWDDVKGTGTFHCYAPLKPFHFAEAFDERITPPVTWTVFTRYMGKWVPTSRRVIQLP